ncbi:hypothetical protein LXL04_022853 [Taraxacum kok-saghyz]
MKGVDSSAKITRITPPFLLSPHACSSLSVPPYHHTSSRVLSHSDGTIPLHACSLIPMEKACLCTRVSPYLPSGSSYRCREIRKKSRIHVSSSYRCISIPSTISEREAAKQQQGPICAHCEERRSVGWNRRISRLCFCIIDQFLPILELMRAFTTSTSWNGEYAEDDYKKTKMVNDAVDSALDSDDIEDEIDEEVDKVLTSLAGETAAQLPEAVRKEKLINGGDTTSKNCSSSLPQTRPHTYAYFYHDWKSTSIFGFNRQQLDDKIFKGQFRHSASFGNCKKKQDLRALTGSFLVWCYLAAGVFHRSLLLLLVEMGPSEKEKDHVKQSFGCY